MNTLRSPLLPPASPPLTTTPVSAAAIFTAHKLLAGVDPDFLSEHIAFLEDRGLAPVCGAANLEFVERLGVRLPGISAADILEPSQRDEQQRFLTTLAQFNQATLEFLQQYKCLSERERKQLVATLAARAGHLQHDDGGNSISAGSETFLDAHLPNVPVAE